MSTSSASSIFRRVLKVSVALSLPVALGGCYTIASGVIDSATKSYVEASATPESMGVSTAKYRSYECPMLADLRVRFREQAQDASLEPLMRKSMGWEADAASQVFDEKGCSTAGAGGRTATGSNGEVQPAMYGFCWFTSDRPSRGERAVHNVTALFAYPDWYADSGQHENLQFQQHVRTSLGGKHEGDGACVHEDSREKAATSRQRILNLFRLNGTVTVREIGWLPQGRPARAAAAGQAPTAGLGGVAASVIPAPAAPKVEVEWFCVFWMQNLDKPDGLITRALSAGMGRPDAERMHRALDGFIAQVKRAEPGRWTDKLEPATCSSNDNAARCSRSWTPSFTFLGDRQEASQTCYAGKQAAEADLSKIRSMIKKELQRPFDHQP